ncbi:MAG: hypothetical protein ACREWG_03435 [Gammaproteobacteria bacterium]
MYQKHCLFRATLTAAVLVLTSASALAVVPPVDSNGVPAAASCPRDPITRKRLRLLHFDKIIFVLNQTLIAADPADQAAINQLPIHEELDIKVVDDPRTVADLKGKVLTFLMAANTFSNRGHVQIVDVDYAVICAR